MHVNKQEPGDELTEGHGDGGGIDGWAGLEKRGEHTDAHAQASSIYLLNACVSRPFPFTTRT